MREAGILVAAEAEATTASARLRARRRGRRGGGGGEEEAIAAADGNLVGDSSASSRALRLSPVSLPVLSVAYGRAGNTSCSLNLANYSTNQD